MLVRVLSMPARGRPTASQWPVTRAPQKHFDACKRVLPCVSMCGGGEPHTRAACVSSVFWTRVIVCEAQSSERERGTRGRGSGKARCADMPFCREIGSDRRWTEFCAPQTSHSGMVVTASPRNRRKHAAAIGRSPRRADASTLPRVCVIACARRKPHHQNSLQSLSQFGPRNTTPTRARTTRN